MRPLSLKAINYRNIASLDLNMSSIEAAAITGPNGAGKSSICESILYALFGEGRSSQIDGIVKLGADEACVELEFIHNGNLFRVIRKRSRGKRSDLQYLIADPIQGGEYDAGCYTWRPLTGATIAETQEKIAKDLSMDKHLFLASSFVMQGDSAGICTAAPRDRKELLIQVLEDRLGKFGPLHEAAKATVRGIDEALAAGRAKRSDLEARVGTKPDLLASKKTNNDSLAELNKQLGDAEAELERTRRAEASLKADQERHQDLERQIAELYREINSLDTSLEEQQKVIRSSQGLLANADSIRARCDDAERLERQLGELASLRDRYQALIDEYRQVESGFALEQEKQRAEARDKSNRIRAEHSGFEADRKQIETRIEGLARQISEAKKQAELLSEVPCQGSDMADECKLLANARDAAKRIDDLDADQFTNTERLKEVAALCGEAGGKIEAHEQATARGLSEMQARQESELAKLKAQAVELGYKPEEHRKIQESFEEAKRARALLPELAAAESRTEAAQKSTGKLRDSLESKRSQVVSIEGDRDEVAARIKLVADPFAPDMPTVVSGFRAAIDIKNRELAVIEEKLREVDEADNELSELSAGLNAQERQRVIYATLMDAFSRNGIPALVIDAAVPDIEERANEILSKLSDGSMMLKLVTQKQTGNGIAETLDIIVSDAAGERLYEDWSGGEKLRIDLSVRIALGQLLAHRSGAAIETLILDEVCAPLDEAGEDALVDCIDRLRDSFKLILLITHREGLKDRLPQQITVTKNGHGSEVRLVA